MLLLFTKVDQPPATQPQTAVWHFGWHVTNERQTMARLRADGVTLLPLYTGDEGDRTVNINSDTYPGTGGVLGLTRAQTRRKRRRTTSSRPAAPASPTSAAPTTR